MCFIKRFQNAIFAAMKFLLFSIFLFATFKTFSQKVISALPIQEKIIIDLTRATFGRLSATTTQREAMGHEPATREATD
jgi:hypothetical protein